MLQKSKQNFFLNTLNIGNLFNLLRDHELIRFQKQCKTVSKYASLLTRQVEISQALQIFPSKLITRTVIAPLPNSLVGVIFKIMASNDERSGLVPYFGT